MDDYIECDEFLRVSLHRLEFLTDGYSAACMHTRTTNVLFIIDLLGSTKPESSSSHIVLRAFDAFLILGSRQRFP